MMEGMPDEQVLEAAGLDRSCAMHALESPSMARWAQLTGLEGPEAWIITMDNVRAILRRYQPYQSEADVRWEHVFTGKLASTGFPASRPVKLFSGRSWYVADSGVWGLVTYLPGRALEWDPSVALSEVGAFLARYHASVVAVEMENERPTGSPLIQLPELAQWDKISSGLANAGQLKVFRVLLDELLEELASLRYAGLEPGIIHGDFTTDNVIVDGSPPSIVGAIDFGFSYRDALVADIGFALWRSGRAAAGDMKVDLGRVYEFVQGYHRVRPLSHDQARVIPLLMKARGIQLVVRWTARESIDVASRFVPILRPTLERTLWLREHQADLQEAVSAALAD